MEKEAQAESLATVTIKPDYPPSEYSSEPPPAYVRPQSTAVQVAKIVAVTVVVMSVVLGGFILASAYVTANASCRQLEQELELLSEAADRFQQSQGPLQPEALVQDEPVAAKRQAENDDSKKEINTNSIDNSDDKDDSSSSSSSESEDEERTPIHFKLPLQLDFDDLAGALIEKNQKSRMNCVVEKKRAEEFVDHQPKTVRLPFGLNLTTDPRIERLSGERMAIFCESGNMQRTEPQQQQQQDDDQQEDTIMIQPVVIPIPHTNFQTHMPQQMAPQPQPQQIPFPMHPQMRPIPQQQQQPQQFHRIFPVEGMRPPMPPPMQVQQQTQVPPQQSEENGFPPSQILHQIAQQIIAQKIMESQKAREEQESSSQQDNDNRMPIPEEILTQLNRLPNRDGISIVAVAEPDSDESSESQEQTLQVIQEPRRSAHAMNGRQTYGKSVFVPLVADQQEQEPQAAASDENRPHYVQPRSVRNTRSVDTVFQTQKRVKRCSCDCAC